MNMENRSTQVCVIIKHMFKVQLVMKCVYTLSQEEELETLQAIYGADFQLHSQDPCVYSVSVATPDGSHRLWLQVVTSVSLL